MLDTNDGNLQDLNEETEATKTQVAKQETPTETIETPIISDKKSEVEVVDEIEEKIAETSEKVVEHKEEVPNYEGMSLESLVDSFDKLFKNNQIQKINKQANAIKNSFDEQFSKLLAGKKAVFLEQGGESINFSYTNPLKNQFNGLIKDFRDARTKYYKNLESELKDNLELRMSVIEQLKDLIENAEPKTMYNQFRDIQTKWKKIGPVVRERYNDTWKTFHHHVERFYDLLHMSNDFRDLDFKHNLEEKLKLIVQVETLAVNEDVNYAFKQLQVIHKRWKEEIGPVAREFRDDIWDKFSAATKKIHDKRHENFKKLRGKYEENIVKKIEIIAEINAIDTSKNSKHSDWQQSIKVIEGLREKFFKAGNVPKSESDKIWNQFKEATRKFNRNKNTFYKNIKGVQQENLDKKMKLIEQAESLKDSEEWKEVTDVMKKIQADWRKIGHVPRKYSDKIWNQFKGACNHYFDRFHTYQNAGSKEEQEIFENKKSLLETINKKVEASDKVDLDSVKNYIKDWRSLGRVPHSMRHIEAKFSKVVDNLFSNLSIDNKQKEMIKFENQMEGLLAQNNLRKLDSEQIYIRKKIDESIREIQQLETNISFFANAKSDNPLLKNVVKSIDNHKSNLDDLKSKLRYLSNLDY
ncbi:MAG: chromosome segregation protein [Lutibacter sp.]|nr:MAG: chromosome segregation protein [Lutibacter sp.]